MKNVKGKKLVLVPCESHIVNEAGVQSGSFFRRQDTQDMNDARASRDIKGLCEKRSLISASLIPHI